MENLKVKLDREYEQLLQQFQKEIERLHQTHQQELEKRVSIGSYMVGCASTAGSYGFPVFRDAPTTIWNELYGSG